MTSYNNNNINLGSCHTFLVGAINSSIDCAGQLNIRLLSIVNGHTSHFKKALQIGLSSSAFVNMVSLKFLVVLQSIHCIRDSKVENSQPLYFRRSGMPFD